MGHFLELVAEIMGVELTDISMETEYKNYDKWDSLMMLTLVMELEAEYRILIPIEKLDNVKTLRDMYELVRA